MLTMLNEGVPPNEEDMEWVIQSADEIGDGEGIETPEVLQLISAWYIRPSLQPVEEEDPEDLKGQDAAAAPRKGSKKDDSSAAPQHGGASAPAPQDCEKQQPAAVSPNQAAGSATSSREAESAPTSDGPRLQPSLSPPAAASALLADRRLQQGVDSLWQLPPPGGACSATAK
eukprot:CAMPEP_0172159382 /NCGR_PEP_ID=MMETSP1050-20130122/4929_1 /TAXON_ID=233186 /ORGANISM="Cryptomonas curvata, Strain CCAP979/52" /LENGTH=171 /DNA_ID=CAMNT_0012828943 /DNA_START=480 /DNA_END=996 /DNA_ORIENTATION=-